MRRTLIAITAFLVLAMSALFAPAQAVSHDFGYAMAAQTPYHAPPAHDVTAAAIQGVSLPTDNLRQTGVTPPNYRATHQTVATANTDRAGPEVPALGWRSYL